MNNIYGDDIKTLPTDPSEPLLHEKEIINTIFGTVKESRSLQQEIKKLVIITVLFIVFSLPQVNTFLERFLFKERPYVNLAIKGLLFAIAFWLVENYALAKK